MGLSEDPVRRQKILPKVFLQTSDSVFGTVVVVVVAHKLFEDAPEKHRRHSQIHSKSRRQFAEVLRVVVEIN